MAENPTDLQTAINALKSYCLLWNLTVNTSKTKVMIFSRGKIRKKPLFSFGDNELEIVDDYIYLGITMNYNGRFKKAISKQVSQARRAMFKILGKIRQLLLPPDIACELFDKVVLPILLYGSEIWGFEDITQVEIFYRNFLRNVLKVNKSTASCMIYGETGRYELSNIVATRIIGFWCRLLSGKQSKLSCMMFKLMKSMHEDVECSFTSKWVANIIDLLDKYGLSHIWLEQKQVNVNWVKLVFEQRIRDTIKQNWHNEVQNNSQCINYRIVKDNLDFESYLRKLNCNDRINLCKFRCGNHHLPCVAGRYVNIPRSERKCNLCDLNAIGDEFHYLFECTYFSDDRAKYISRYYVIRPNILKCYLTREVQRNYHNLPSSLNS